MSGRGETARRGLLLSLLCGSLVVSVAACGRRGKLRAPEDRKEEFTFPHRYPRPETVLPQPEDESEEGSGS